LNETGLQISLPHIFDIRHRAISRLCNRDQTGRTAATALVAGPVAGWIADRMGDHAADWIIGPGNPAGTDTEYSQFLGLANGKRITHEQNNPE